MKHDRLLAIDTSSRVLSLAVQKEDGSILEMNLAGTPRHSEKLIVWIEKCLKELDLPKKELDCLLWGMGPGSFTGLRIGFSILKGLHVGLGKKAIGGSSLDLIALGSGVAEGKLAVCGDARRESIYFALYHFSGGGFEKIVSDKLVSLDELVQNIDSETVLTGDALRTYGPAIREKSGPEIVFLPETFWYPRALFLIHLYEQHKNRLIHLNLRNMTPQYLRHSEAEEKSGLIPKSRRPVILKGKN